MSLEEIKMNSESKLSAINIFKTFDRTKALVGANLELFGGKVHGLLGANGAGKSTLSKIISGHLQPDSGQLIFEGRPLNLSSTRDALNNGIAIVMQETSLVPDLTVVENIFLPELGRKGFLSYPSLYKRGEELLASLGQKGELPLDIEVRRLSVAQRQLVEIAKALGVQAKLIIFDEPTASLSPSEVDRLFDIMSKLRTAGNALVFVSHRLEEVFEITDQVTVLREGQTVLSCHATEDLNQSDLIKSMVGRDLESIYSRPIIASKKNSPIAMEVKSLESLPMVRDVSFKVHKGEILGLGGLVGAGRSEAAEAIFGLRPHSAGRIWVQGNELHPKRPADAVNAGIGFVAEDRRTQNIVPHLSVKENLLLAHLGAHKGFGLGYKSRDKQVTSLLESLGLPADRLLDANMLNFSGGMQQKIIISRWLLLEPKVLILDEPTKGVDIGTRSSIYSLLRDIAEKGVAVVVISSDFEELLGISDRIVVISDGLSVADLPTELLDKEKLTLLAAPRTSMARNSAMLHDLAKDLGGTGFWALIDDQKMICLNLVSHNVRSQPGFVPGEAKAFKDTLVPLALTKRQTVFIKEDDGDHSTILFPLTSGRGHDLGWIGLTIPDHSAAPSPETIRGRVAALGTTL